MSNSKVHITDNSNVKNVSVNGNNNQVVTDSKNIHIGIQKEPNGIQHWLEVIYWIVGIGVALITIYNFII